MASAPPVTTVRGDWLRQTPDLGTATDPLALPPVVGPGRWHTSADTPPVYLALDPLTPWRELTRLAERLALTDPGAMFPRLLWTIAVDLADVVDLRDRTALETVGLHPPRPSDADWPPFQSVGRSLRDEGAAGLLYPSAVDGLDCLAVFRPFSADALSFGEAILFEELPKLD